MTKLKAFTTHLGISLVIFLIVLYFILVHWYPFPYFNTDGGWQGIRILAFVDVVLGPMLTLLVFKQGKKYLKLDLSIIALIQISALCWGIWLIHRERPVAAVFVEDYFITVTANELDNKLNPTELKKFGATPPVLIYLNVPQAELQQVRLRSLQTGRSMSLFTEYYAPLDAAASKAMADMSIDMPKFLADKPVEKNIYERFVRTHANEMDKYVFLEWNARYRKGIVVARANTLEIITFLKIEPPKVETKKARF
jgi:hypothetical protein